MSLLGFRYLNSHRVLTLVLILALTSTLFLVTAQSFMGIYNGFSAYLGEDNDTIAVYSNVGRTPFTGVLPACLADTVGSLNGVLVCSPEAIAPCVVNGKSVFIRGVVSEEFTKINPLTMLEGNLLDVACVDGVIVGKGFAQRLNLSVGDRFLAFGVLSSQFVELHVVGIYVSGSVMDDEALVPLYVGQWLRGSSYNYVSLIRVKTDPSKLSAAGLYGALASHASPDSTPSLNTQTILSDLIPSLSQIGYQIDDLGVEDTQTFMQRYLNNYGVTQDTFLILSVMVLGLAGGTAMCALTLFLDQHKREITVMRTVGASQRKIKTDLLIKLLFLSLAASLLGASLATGILTVLGNGGYLQVLSHGICFTFNPSVFVANFVLIGLLVAVGVTRWSGKP